MTRREPGTAGRKVLECVTAVVCGTVSKSVFVEEEMSHGFSNLQTFCRCEEMEAQRGGGSSVK